MPMLFACNDLMFRHMKVSQAICRQAAWSYHMHYMDINTSQYIKAKLKNKLFCATVALCNANNTVGVSHCCK